MHIFNMSKFRYYCYQHFFLYQISPEAYIIIILLHLYIQKNETFGGIGHFSIKIVKCTEWKNLEKSVPSFKTVSLNTKFFIWIVYSTHTLILNKSKMRFEYLGVLDAPMNLLYYCIRFCLNNYGDLNKELYETKKLKKIF